MTKITSTVLTILLLSSCGMNAAQKEAAKSAKAQSATSRINASEQNTKNTLNDLDKELKSQNDE